jgi:NTP pyrophosphatase (non-canonical NTP hydrolase)
MSEEFKEKQNLDKYVEMFCQIYEPIQNIERNFYQILARLLEAISQCSQFVNRADERRLAENLPKVFAWFCSLVFKSDLKTKLSEVAWKKFPSCCPYCVSEPCKCSQGRKTLEENSSKLEELSKNVDSKPTTLDDWQNMFAHIYPREPQLYDQKSNFAHLIEELGEASEAYRIRFFYPTALESELADIFSWILGMANLLDARARDGAVYPLKDYRLERQIFERYSGKCPNCKRIPCNCVIKEVKQKISELNVVYPEDIIKEINKSAQKLGIELKSEFKDLFNQPEAQLFLQDLKTVATGYEISEEKIKVLINEIVKAPHHKKWYEKITASGIAENAIVSLFTMLTQASLM